MEGVHVPTYRYEREKKKSRKKAEKGKKKKEMKTEMKRNEKLQEKGWRSMDAAWGGVGWRGEAGRESSPSSPQKRPATTSDELGR